MKRTTTRAIAAAAVLVGLLAACSDASDDESVVDAEDGTEDREDATEDSGDASMDDGLLIGLVIPQADKYFDGIQEGLEQAVEAGGGELIVVNSQNDAAREATNVQNLITRQVDAIILQPANTAAGSIATMESIRDAGIPLVCFGNCTDDAASPDLVGGVVQSDNTALGTGTGEVAAAYINDNLGGEANIAILNCDSFEVCLLRKDGFQQALEDAGVTANYVADQEGFLADDATPIAANIMTANPDIDIFWAANDGGTVAALSAVRAAGSEIKVFGTDISEQLAEALLDPEDLLQATTGQDPVATAVAAYGIAEALAAGDEVQQFEMGIPGQTFTRSNPAEVSEYLEN